MTLKGLSEAAVSYSDSTAINLIINQLGGLPNLTTFAHNIGNQSFNVSHYEANLNSNPKNIEDTVTPKDMAKSVQSLVLGNVLSQTNKQLLRMWMLNNTTGDKRIRAGAPVGWQVADRTGSGSYGVANDIGILWFSTCKPIVLAIYTVSDDKNAKPREDVLADAAKIALNDFAKSDNCISKSPHI